VRVLEKQREGEGQAEPGGKYWSDARVIRSSTGGTRGGFGKFLGFGLPITGSHR